MPEFAFVSLDPKKRQQSEHVRRAVRSQAARSSAPTKKRPEGPAQQTHAKVLFTDEIRITRTQRQTVPILNLNWKFPSRPSQLEFSNSVSSTQIAPLVPVPALESRTLNDPELWTDNLSSQETVEALRLLTEPTHPNLVLQPLMAAPFSPFLNDYYLKNMACDIPDLDQGIPGRLREIWYPYALTHEGLMHVIFLTAGSSFANSSQCHADQLSSVRVKLIELKVQGLFHIRRMLASSSAPTNDPAIAIVCKMANYESIYGSLEAYNMHMHALKRLVTQRGGTKNLGLDGLLARMILWIDYNSACIHNTNMHFPEEARYLPKPMEFDPEFLIGRLN